MEWDFASGLWGSDPSHRFRENRRIHGRREEINCGIRDAEFGIENKEISILQSAICVSQSKMVLGEFHGEGGSFAQLTFDLNVSPMEFDNFLNEGKTNS
jgi:hypothetical protein